MTSIDAADALGLAAQTRVRIAPSVYARAFGQELVLLDFGRGEYFGLDAVGAEIWTLLEAGRSLGEIADALVERFDVARDVALEDVTSLVSHMRDQALLSVVT